MSTTSPDAPQVEPQRELRLADVIVVGGGPAGAAAAIGLARAGRDVVVVDRATFPRDKCCGDGLTALALRLLEDLGLAPGTVASWTPVEEAVLHAPGGRAVRLPLGDGDGLHAAVARRADLDAALLALAAGAGVEVVEGHAVTAVRAGADRVTAEVSGWGQVAARYLIAADGMWSPTRRLLGLDVPGYRGDWHAFRQYLHSDGPAANELHVVFEPDILPGYFWAFPAGGVTNAGFGVPRGGAVAVGDMGARWRELLTRPRIAALLGPSARPEGPLKALPIPARVGRLPLAHGRVLFVGDAAAVTDPMTGEGIGQALLTGRLAADATLAAGPLRPADAGSAYRRAVLADLRTDHRLAERLSGALRSPRCTDAAIGTVALSSWTRRNFGRWMFEDYPRAVAGTPRRWTRGMFTPVGAFRDVPCTPAEN
jgi:geranylgeranyl reductase family protein